MSVWNAKKRPIPLGSFELYERLGKGGMATVWRARHVSQDVRVAIKVITAAYAREPMFLDAFESEVRSVASLDHPGIVMILDHGLATEESAVASDGEIAADSPYLVMELATGGSFDQLDRALTWPELSQLLHALLDALAHAHARGVLHRDLKPGNLLVSGPTDHRAGLKLTDFGIAHLLERDGPPRAHEISGGTPVFMAPEQVENAWRDYGPWTDLYAIGCIAFLYASGRPPFGGDTPFQLAKAHLSETPPRLIPVHPMPGDLEAWILRLLEKAPKDRYHRAADAAWALTELSPGRLGKPVRRRSIIPSTPIEDAVSWSNAQPEEIVTEAVQVAWEATLPWVHDTEELQGADLRMLFDEDSAPERPRSPPVVPDLTPQPLPRIVPPLPPLWRRASTKTPPLSLWGVGLGLFGLRPIPMIGRERERDVIWSALSRVREERSARAVLLQGAAGTGKSRLAEWMAQRAAEVGNAMVFRAIASGEGDPLKRMLARYLRLEDLSGAELLGRCEQVLRNLGATNPADWATLSELISPTHEGQALPSGAYRIKSAVERHALVRRIIELYAKERPVVIILDDVHANSDLILFANAVLEAQSRSSSPILILLTAREEALSERPQEASLLHHLLGSERTERLAISPLNPDDHLKLVHELLGLEQALAHQVARRTAGNPSFAVELVGDWVERGALELSSEGFRLLAGESGILPDGIHDVWAERLGILLGDQPETTALALELGAILGRAVSQVEWVATCGTAGVPFPEALIDTMIAERLLQPSSKGWHFQHGMLKESIERRARDAGRLPMLHTHCAATLLERYGLFSPGMAERIGHHYAAAGLHKEALSPLLRGAEARYRASEYLEAQALLRMYERSLNALGAPRADARWCECFYLRAQIAQVQGNHRDAIAFAQKAADSAARWDLQPLLAAAKLELAKGSALGGDHVKAMALFHEAQTIYQTLGDEAGVAQCHLGIAELRYRLGNLEGAQDRYLEALVILEKVGALEEASCLWGLGFIALWRSEFDRAKAYFSRQQKLSEEAGNRHGVARCITGLAEIARVTGDLATAEEGYLAALAIYEAIGAKEATTTYINLALIRLAEGRPLDAGRLIETMRSSSPELQEGQVDLWLNAVTLAAAPETGDFAEWDRLFESIVHAIETTRFVDGDLAWVVEQAAHQAFVKGHSGRGRAALALAQRLWRTLGLTERVEAITQRLTEDP